ncbi:acyltransferase domain-containing protein [Candidatus Entotheonella palauensis]|uniref:Malonyl-CoA:ACP transacylase (MAT) domain-containing protein n=1 Tax=Candidatus Entotheonella gemina TaxID=1429439 RepID=W4MEV0_9BACT|nr:acyltransferase domain-containing protein [Candidatus Entotheonella palauensis]ETX08446.1 MAG: hypothetical protein ETSY2_05380 [Candidatus Entotheonella gemina]
MSQPGPVVERPLHLLALSARSEPELLHLVHRYERYLAVHPELSLADLCYTVNTKAAHDAHRLAFYADETASLHEQLKDFIAHGEWPRGSQGQGTPHQQPKVAFLFSGLGSEYVNMGRQLYETQPTFRAALDQCAEIVRPDLRRPLLSLFYPESGSESALYEIEYMVTVSFAVQYALAQMWGAWGIVPDLILGHSTGGYVAGCVAGCLSVEDGLNWAVTYGRLATALSEDGLMAAVFAPEERVAAALAPYADQVSLAAVNSPKNTVISGSKKAICAITEALKAEGLTVRQLAFSHAGHSPLIDPLMPTIADVLGRMDISPPRLPLVSPLTGEIIEPGICPDRAYWVNVQRQTTRFLQAMQTLFEQGCNIFLEIGPHTHLLTLGKACHPTSAGAWLPTLRRGRQDWPLLLDSLCTLFNRGVEVSWSGFDQDYERHRLSGRGIPYG